MADLFERYRRYKVRRLERLSHRIKPGKLLFFGDSITDFWPLKKHFAKYDPVNSGISGDTTCDLLARAEVCVYAYHPRAVVLLIGVNDIINENRKAAEIVENIRLLLEEMQAHGIKRILVQSCYPTFGRFAFANEEILQLNDRLKELASAYGCLYADVHAALLDPNGSELCKAYSDDGLHPNKAGYAVAAAVLSDFLQVL